jgi:ABC-type transport system involved in cytochrome bd biosynthesis fused ATPase/permease subunit
MAILLRKLNFTWRGDERVLKNINLNTKTGQNIAFVGRSGVANPR